MDPNSSSDHLSEALVRAVQHWESRHRGGAVHPSQHAFTVALSREVGTRGPAVAKEVAVRLGWAIYDHEILERIAQEMRLRVSLLESVDERRVSWLEECVEALSSVPTVSENSYVRHLIQTIMSLAAHGECVIVGRGAAQILPPATTLRVRLFAPVEDRVQMVREELSLSADKAARHVETTDRERARFIMDHFQKDLGDLQQYDVAINSGRYSVNQCADLIIEALHRLQKHAAEKSRPTAAV